MARLKNTEDTLSLSFLDVLSCALGATVLLYLVLSASARSYARNATGTIGEEVSIPVWLEVRTFAPLTWEGAVGSCLGYLFLWNAKDSEGPLIVNWVDVANPALFSVAPSESIGDGAVLRVVAHGEMKIQERNAIGLPPPLWGKSVAPGVPLRTFRVTDAKRTLVDRDDTSQDTDGRVVAGRFVRECTVQVHAWRLMSDRSAVSLGQGHDEEEMSIARWSTPAFSIGKRHELRICGPKVVAQPTFQMIVSKPELRVCANSVASSYERGCYVVLWETDGWKLDPDGLQCPLPPEKVPAFVPQNSNYAR